MRMETRGKAAAIGECSRESSSARRQWYQRRRRSTCARHGRSPPGNSANRAKINATSSVLTFRPLSGAPSRLVIASRRSRLAMWQSEHVAGELRRLYPSCRVDILGVTTRGDQVLDQSLANIGGKGLFVKELETALEDGRADLAVHSAKDLPMLLPQGFCLAAITAREDPRDCFVSNESASLDALREGSV